MFAVELSPLGIKLARFLSTYTDLNDSGECSRLSAAAQTTEHEVGMSQIISSSDSWPERLCKEMEEDRERVEMTS